MVATTPEYRAFGSFAPIYTSAIDKLYSAAPVDRARQAHIVLHAIASHADPVGLCFPGLGHLAARTRYSVTTVRRALMLLDEMDYIRVHVEYVTTRRRELITYQLSPWVLWIVSEHIEHAISLWNAASKRFNEIIHVQPESEPESVPDTDLNAYPESNHHHHPGTGGEPRATRNTEKPKKAARSAAPARSADSDQRSAPDDSATRSTQRRTPPPAPPLSACRAPLPNPDDERLAARLAAEIVTRDAQARQLVQQYGAVLVDQALAWLQVELKAGNVQKPAGLLNWWLKESVLTGKPPAPRRQSLAAGYEDLFER